MSSFSSSSRNQESEPIHNPDPNQIYDVFLSSKRGDDSKSYTSHLYTCLRKEGISVFWDDDSLPGDDHISPSQRQAIQNSRISVVVLSEGYGGSRRCLEVLDQIIEWRRVAGQFVVPVFLNFPVDSVRFHGGRFREAFDDLTETISDKDKVISWRIDLARICKIKDHCVVYTDGADGKKNWSGNDKNIEKVIKLVKDLLDRTDLFVAEHVVGLDYRVNEIRALVDYPKAKGVVLLLGIWGMVGIGKTTIAKAIYNHIHGDFEGRSFLPSISEVWEQDTGHVYLQEWLLSDICKLPKIKIDCIEVGKKILREKLSHKKVLLVLDDVNKLEQLNALCGNREWFGPGSMIIITTRDRSLLVHRVDHVYNMSEMNEIESNEIFNAYAKMEPGAYTFNDRLPRDVVAYAKGLPLALEVLGSKHFEGRLCRDLDELKEFTHPMVQKLKRCVADLNNIEKDIFLDIAYFLIGMDREKAIQTLSAFENSAKDGVKALEDRCLVTIDKMTKLGMHVWLQEIGREIIHEQMQVKVGSKIYHVCLSLGGEDARTTFTSHLYTCLANAKVNFFKDDHEIIRGDRISVSQLQAIEKSRISIVVLSKYYASSRRCLQELEKIMECRKTIGQVVVPVFYGVDPSTVCNQTGMIGEAFQELLKTFSVKSDKEKSWRIALREVSGIPGIAITDFRNNSEDVKNVVEHVIHFSYMSVVEHPVGVEARVQDVIQLLNSEKSKDVILLGIWGMGGSGKTTIAKAIYNKFGRKYESKSFLQNISEVCKQDNGQLYLQEKLLSDIDERTKVKIDGIKSGKKRLIERLRYAKMLLVLDDVDKLEQLNAFCGGREWFGLGSKIIITTRDKSLLDELGVDHVYKMKEMDESESVMLFSWHAFKQPSPRDDFIELSRDVVAYCGGLPLALEELGRELCGKEITEWKSLLDRYKRVPHPMIHKALKRSFESLSDDKVKNIFLDIALFFIGWDQNEVIQKLNGFRDFAATSVHVLVERSLITVDETNKLGMHVWLRDMAREILSQQSRLQIGPRIYDVFLSFSKDTPSSFTSRLIGSMEKAGISVYRNDDSLSRDDQISPSLLQIIQKSRIFIVVLSTGYARSRRCLQVLEQITECCRIAGQFVLPVLSNVSPSDVLSQFGEFGKAFDDLTKRISDKDKVESWKTAFARISQVQSSNTFCYGNNDDDNIKSIVIRTEDLLNTRNLFVVEFPVGVDSRVGNATQLVTHHKSKDVLLLGIWGMVGIGKTTIAKAIYNKYGGEFEGRSFLPNIKEVWELDKRHVYLQERLLSDVYKLPKIKIDSTKIGKKMLKEMLSHKKVLLVLDDVNKLKQLNVLCESREWFGSGSMIIITTRDRSLLRMHGVDHVYSMKEMDENESRQLFRNYTFSKRVSDQCSTNVVAYAGGLPLALEVLSCKVSGGWEADKLIKSPHPVVQKVLKRCVNDLNNIEKSIFLDIASFLIGMDREEVVQALNTFGNLAEKGIRALENQCLVTFDEMNKLRMHVLLQEIGREIVREQIQEKPQPWIYDVFLSFRGEDTRATFTSHLNTYFANAGIYVFMDDDKIRRGDWISISLLQAIKRSRTFVVVLSRHYANSRWCLQELENIMVCYETYGRAVLPVFYGVDPSAVRKQKDKFGEAFQDLLKRFSVESDKEKSWRRALRRIGGIAGIVIKDSRNESEDINQIVENIIGLLENTILFVAQHPVGVKSRVQQVIKQLDCQQSKDVQLLGISGIGGIGKTTIAKAIYNQIHCDFEACCFLSDIREKWEQFTSRVDLQEQLLSDVCKTSKEKITNIDSGKIKLKERLCHKRILLILDDVDKLDQLKALCWSREWFGPGSRIIITTRVEGLLRVLEVDHISRMSEMDNNESVEHFSWHAFKQASPKEGFVELSKDVVAYCKGLPLALEVIGSSLFDKEVEEWQSVLEKLKTIPNHQVQKKLRISFDSLDDDTEKEIFLDITFFFIGMDQNDVIQILAEENYPAIGIRNLIDRSLVTTDNNNKLRMHDLLRDMGREIVREESLKEPEQRSRLWLQKDVLKVLQKHTGTKAIEGLALNLARINTVCLKTEAFKKMHRLRLLQLAGVQLSGDFEYLSKDLRWLYWHGFPFNCIPPNFDQASLVAIELEASCLGLVWRETQILEKLKVLNLSHSHKLTQTPDMSFLPNLEKLLLKDCPSLSAISDTIGDLKKILLIDLEDCTSLSNLPRSFYKLKSLETLIISGCSTIDKLEEDIEQMESLIALMADKTQIKEVPFSIIRSRSIRYISICGYEGFSRDVFPSLIWSWMSPTNVLSFSSLVQTCASSEYVSSDAPKLRSLRSNHKQGVKRILDILDATYCRELEATKFDFPNQFHISRSAKSLLLEVGMKSQVTRILRERIIQKLTTSGPDDCLLPSDSYPLTFNCEGSSVIFEVPPVNGGNLGTMMLCIVYSSSLDTMIPDCLQSVLVTIYTKSTTQVYKRDRLASSKDVDWQSIISKLEPGNKVKVQVISGQGFTVKKTAVYLIDDAPVDQNRIGGFFKLCSFVHAVLKTRPLWFGLFVILVSVIVAILIKEEGSSSFQDVYIKHLAP